MRSKSLCSMLAFSILCLISLTDARAGEPSPVPSFAPTIQFNTPTKVLTSDASAPVYKLAPEPSIPPVWAQDLIVQASKLPLVGPLVSKALLYAGILSGILTTFIAFLLGTLATLKGVSNWAGLVSIASKIDAFQKGPIMFYLKFFSNFNAQKPVDPSTASSQKA